MACLNAACRLAISGPERGGSTAHDQRVLRVLHIRHDALQPCLGRGVVLVFVVGLVARPVAALEVEVEARRLIAALIGPAEVDAIQVGGVAVAQPQGERVAAVDLGVLAVELAADLREAVGGDELVAEALALLLVAGDALGELQADVLELDEVARSVPGHRGRRRSDRTPRPGWCPAPGARSRTSGSASSWP